MKQILPYSSLSENVRNFAVQIKLKLILKYKYRTCRSKSFSSLFLYESYMQLGNKKILLPYNQICVQCTEKYFHSCFYHIICLLYVLLDSFDIYHVNRAFLSAVKYPFSAKSVLNSMSPLRQKAGRTMIVNPVIKSVKNLSKIELYPATKLKQRRLKINTATSTIHCAIEILITIPVSLKRIETP